jgi:hypothetical protein
MLCRVPLLCPAIIGSWRRGGRKPENENEALGLVSEFWRHTIYYNAEKFQTAYGAGTNFCVQLRRGTEKPAE